MSRGVRDSEGLFVASHCVVLTVCAVSVFGATAEIKFTVPVGKFFTYELTRETFQNDFEPLSRIYSKNPTHSPCCDERTKPQPFSVCSVKLATCTMTPWCLSATGRTSQTSQSGCASPNAIHTTTASCTERRPLRGNLSSRYD